MKSYRPTDPLIASAELSVEAPVTVEDDQVEFAAQLAEESGATHRLWFRFRSACSSLLTRRADPFVIATAVYALGRYARLHVHGTVSEGLFAILADFQAAFAAFHVLPLAQPVAYSADEFAFPSARSERVTGIAA